MLIPIKPKRISDLVFEQLRDLIFKGHIKPGDKLIVVVHGGKVLTLERPKSYHDAVRGRGTYPKNYLKKERDSWK